MTAAEIYGDHANITINDGAVTAEGGICGNHADITINGGMVEATGSGGGAGIGTEANGAGSCDITINGGTVKASSKGGAGIGACMQGEGCNIKINGGTVEAYSDLGAGIGGGWSSSSQGTLSSDPNGSAWIKASSVDADTSGFNGVIFDESNGGNGKVYGSASINDEFAIPYGKTLEIPEGTTLTVDQYATLNASNGKLDNKGTIVNDGTVKLPSETDIAALKMTGSGIVVMDGLAYNNDGTLRVSPEPLTGKSGGGCASGAAAIVTIAVLAIIKRRAR